MAAQRAGVDDSFDAFYRREYGAVVALVYALSGSRAAAEDLAQDAFLATHRVWARVVHYDDPGGFVRRVALNRAISAARRLAAETRALARLSARARPVLEPLDAPGAEFWSVVRSLPRRQAQVVVLRYLEDRADDDIARILGCSEATVRVHMHRARPVLARRLGLSGGRS